MSRLRALWRRFVRWVARTRSVFIVVSYSTCDGMMKSCVLQSARWSEWREKKKTWAGWFSLPESAWLIAVQTNARAVSSIRINGTEELCAGPVPPNLVLPCHVRTLMLIAAGQVLRVEVLI